LRGEARYVDDLAMAQLWVAFVRSPIAHGRVQSIDRDAARAAPGVVDVFTAADLGIQPIPPHPMLPDVFSRPPLVVHVPRRGDEYRAPGKFHHPPLDQKTLRFHNIRECRAESSSAHMWSDDTVIADA
jgi:CO/xanthine dehydrogenase Mo-binding subunit